MTSTPAHIHLMLVSDQAAANLRPALDPILTLLTGTAANTSETRSRHGTTSSGQLSIHTIRSCSGF